MKPIESIYRAVKDAGIPMDNHESDLYVKVTPESTKILEDSGHSFSTFANEVDKTLWFDVPFAYTPWWSYPR